jgi:signal transduction histidine kinase
VPPSSDITRVLVVFPGDLIYYLAIFGISQAALLVALGLWLRRRDNRTARLYALGTVAAVLAWMLLMVSALFALLTSTPLESILAPIDRLSHTLVILVLGWVFVTADHERFGRAGNVLLLVLLALLGASYIVTGIEWAGVYAATEFNAFSSHRAWLAINLALALAGLVLSAAYFRVVRDAPLKMVYFGVLALGAALALAIPATGDYSGVTRMAFLAAMVLALGVVYRAAIVGYEEARVAALASQRQAEPLPSATTSPVTPAPPPLPVSERESAQLMKALGLMLEKAAPSAIPERVVNAALNTLKADVGTLLVQKGAYAEIVYGHDRAMGREVRSFSLNLEPQPTLADAIDSRAQRVLLPASHRDELTDLYGRLDIDTSGPTYFQPLVSDGELLAVLMLGLPYNGRELTEPERELLRGIGIIAANLLSLSAAVRGQRMAPAAAGDGGSVDDLRAHLAEARGQISTLQGQITTLRIELDDERSRLARTLGDTQEGQAISERIVTLNEAHQNLLRERDRLAERLTEVEKALQEGTPAEVGNVLRSLVEVLRSEKDDLARQRDQLRAELNDIRRTGVLPASDNAQDMLERMGAEKARVEEERDSLGLRLAEVEAQLAVLSASGSADSPIEMVQRQLERDQMVRALQTELANVAADREAAVRQRDRMRAEMDELSRRQESMRSLQARVLAENASFEQELVEAHDELAQLRAELQRFANDHITLAQERDRLNAERSKLENEREQLLARVEGDRARLQQLGVDGVGQLTKIIDEVTAQRAAVERELHETRDKLAEVENKMQVLEIRAASVQPQVVYRPDNPDALVGMVQELRTPMTSIVGYVDLLLNESAGILGEMQRKFLQRVSANVHRLSTMTDDLIQLAYLDAGKIRLRPQWVDLIEVLEDAITSASAPLREKGLTVHLQLEDDAPPVCADREALEQVIGQLLTNAYLASPPGTEIFISARSRMQQRQVNGGMESAPVLEVKFEDRGGGIAPEDLARVFARRYKAENPLIQGLGDTGVGLAIARALIEAHEGEIWVESEAGSGAAFHFVLPAEAEQVVEP